MAVLAIRKDPRAQTVDGMERDPCPEFVWTKAIKIILKQKFQFWTVVDKDHEDTGSAEVRRKVFPAMVQCSVHLRKQDCVPKKNRIDFYCSMCWQQRAETAVVLASRQEKFGEEQLYGIMGAFRSE